MGKFDVTAAAGTAAEESKPAEVAAPAAKKPAAKTTQVKAAPAKKPATAKATPAKKRAPAKKAPATTTMAAPTSLLNDLLDEAEAQSEGLTQIAVRVPPSLRTRLKNTMSRAGLTQEKFIAALIVNGLDELEGILDERESA